MASTNPERARQQGTPARLGLEPRSCAVLTLHRPSHVDDPQRLCSLFPVLERDLLRQPSEAPATASLAVRG